MLSRALESEGGREREEGREVERARERARGREREREGGRENLTCQRGLGQTGKSIDRQSEDRPVREGGNKAGREREQES